MSKDERLDEDGYRKEFKGGHDTLILVKIHIDKILQKSIMTDRNGEKYIDLCINQSKTKKGSLYVTQVMSHEHLKEEGVQPNIVGNGFKHINADYYIRDIHGQDYLEYLLNRTLLEDDDKQ